MTSRTKTSTPPARSSRGPGRRPESVEIPSPLSAALHSAAETPEKDDVWDELEALAAQMDRPDEAGALYRQVLDRALPRDLLRQIGERALRFHDEWFEDRQILCDVLTRILTRDPEASWAFDRLSLVLTGAARFTDLLVMYDVVLSAKLEPAYRFQLLDEAAHVAKDFADRPDQAIRYLEAQLALRPADGQLVASLERLFEKQQRYADLIALWASRLGAMPLPAALATRARIAACSLDHLNQPAEALEVVEGLLKDRYDTALSCELLERVAGHPSADTSTRLRALELLKGRYDESGQRREVIRVLKLSLSLLEPGGQIAAHRDIADRLLEAGEQEEALEHRAAALVLEPGSVGARQSLRDLSAAMGRHDRFVDALTDAADAANSDDARLPLLWEAANVRCDMLGDRPGSIPLYWSIFTTKGAPDNIVLDAARRLDPLLSEESRRAELLDVIERLAALETDQAVRRDLFARVGHIGLELGEIDRALAAWRERLTSEPKDVTALGAIVDLLEHAARWPDLVSALRQRIGVSSDIHEKRDDLVRIARIYSERIDKIDLSIDTWREIEKEFGFSEETVDNLAALLSRAARWKEVAALLERAADAEKGDTARRADLFQRLGHVEAERLLLPTRAAGWYRRAIETDSRHAGARAGLVSLLGTAGCEAEACETLASAYRANDEWQLLLDLVEHRLAAAGTDEARTGILTEAATFTEQRALDLGGALTFQRRALASTPADRAIEGDLLRLARMTGSWSEAVLAYREALPRTSDPARMADLRLSAGAILEKELSDGPGAIAMYLPALDVDPSSLSIAETIVRVAAHNGRWDIVARALLTSARATGSCAPALLSVVEAAAQDILAWDQATLAIESALSRQDDIAPALFREIEAQVATWHHTRRGDDDAAERALLMAVAKDKSHVPTLQMLADLQRGRQSLGLLDTLLWLADATGDDLLVLRETAEVALSSGRDRDARRAILQRLLSASTEAWQKGGAESDNARASATWGIAELCALYTDEGQHATAVDLLVTSSRLPFDAEAARDMLHQAAEIAAKHLDDAARAIQLFRQILEQAPDNERAIRRLGLLLEAQGHFVELIALRRHELSLTTALQRRLELRVDLARVHGLLGQSEERIEALRNNLEEKPDHQQSVEELASVLKAEARYADLAAALGAYAGELEKLADNWAAARVFGEVAVIAETRLTDVELALSAYAKVVALDATNDALDALSRLCIGRGEHEAAVGWLEQRLLRAGNEERAEVVQRLAKSHVAAGNEERAIACLERAIDQDGSLTPLRTELAHLYEKAASWTALAELLEEGLPHVHDAKERLAYLRQAAEIQHGKLATPERAVNLLMEAQELSPDDCPLRTALSDALRDAGRLDAARAILEQLIAEFGRRRSAERAPLHQRLARIAQKEGNLVRAIEELETASSIAAGDPEILALLGELAQQDGQLERAERAYRALLLSLRRRAGGDHAVVEGEPASSEVLFELSAIAQGLGQAERATETLESAFAAALQSDEQARRFEKKLRALGREELLLRALSDRLPRLTDLATRTLVLSEIAETAMALHRPEQALDAWLSALAGDPASAQIHAAAAALALSLGRHDAYVAAINQLAEKAEIKGDAKEAGFLLFQLGELSEASGADPKATASFYERAERVGERLTDVWQALDRLYQKLGDVEGQARVLRQYVGAEASAVDAQAKAEALFRLAEIELNDEALLDEAVDMLSSAIDLDPQFERAVSMLGRTADRFPAHDGVLRLFEHLARATGRTSVLLDALERSAALPGAPSMRVREAVEIATSLDQHARAEGLLEHTIGVAKAEGGSGAAWALVMLAGLKKQAGDVAASVGWLRAAADASEPREALALKIEAAVTAAPLDSGLAASIYEGVLENDPGEREAWGPLLALYRQMGAFDKLEKLIATTLEAVFDSSERNALRFERAQLVAMDPERRDDALYELRQTLEEDPHFHQAAWLLADLLEGAGQHEEVIELLTRQIERATARHQDVAIVDLSLRLARMLEPSSRDHAMAIYRAASDAVPGNKALLTELFRLAKTSDDTEEKATVMERLLELDGDDRVAGAAEMALDLAELRRALGDEDGTTRALELGFLREPANETLRSQLEAWYEARRDWARLAALIVADAALRPDPAEAVARFREAARLQLERLQDPTAAIETLARARNLAPKDTGLLVELVRYLAERGDGEGAILTVTQALDHDVTNAKSRATLLEIRGDLRLAGGDEDGAVADFEQASAAGGPTFTQALVKGLKARRARAEADGDRARQLDAIVRLSEILAASGHVEESRELLYEWLAQDPDSHVGLNALANLARAHDRSDDLVFALLGLARTETGDALVEVSLKLAAAARAAKQPEAARQGLERAQKSAPGDARIRAHLHQLYAEIGARRELAELLLAEADAARDDAKRFDVLRSAAELLLEVEGGAAHAVAPLERALSLRPTAIDVTVMLADAYFASGQPARASTLVSKAVAAAKGRRARELSPLYARMARVTQALNPQDALQWLTLALECDMQNGQVAADLAQVAMQRKEFEVALKALRAIALMKHPGPMSKAMALLQQGVIAHQQGDPKRAVFMTKKALVEDPELAQARAFLKKIDAA